MLIVTDISRLADYGFEKTGKNHSGRDIWNLAIEEGDFELNLTANPLQYDKPETENEIELWGNLDIPYNNVADELCRRGRASVEFECQCDMLFRLIADGVVTLATNKKEAAA